MNILVSAIHDPIVFLHGFAQSPATWNKTISLLESAGYDSCAPDFLKVNCDGFIGDSSGHDYSFSSITARLAAFLNHQGFERINLVGYSMGGRVALYFAQLYPDRLSSLVFESCGLGPSDSASQKINEQRDISLADRLRTSTISDFVDYWETLPLFVSQKKLPSQIRDAVRVERLANDPEDLARIVEGMGQHMMSDMRPLLSEITMPVLYLAGVQDEKYRMLSEEVELIQAISVRRFDTGHDIHLEDTAGFSAALCDFYRTNKL